MKNSKKKNVSIIAQNVEVYKMKKCHCGCCCLDGAQGDIRHRLESRVSRMKSYLPLLVPTGLIVVLVLSFIWLLSTAGNTLEKRQLTPKTSQVSGNPSSIFAKNSNVYRTDTTSVGSETDGTNYCNMILGNKFCDVNYSLDFGNRFYKKGSKTMDMNKPFDCR